MLWKRHPEGEFENAKKRVCCKLCMNNVDSFKEFVSNIDGYPTAESVVLAYIRELDYPEVHPFLEYPYSDEGITLFPIIMLKLYDIDEIVIKELLPESAEFT